MNVLNKFSDEVVLGKILLLLMKQGFWWQIF